MFNMYPPSEKRNMASEIVPSRPEMIAGFTLSLWNTLSESQPARTVPTTPNAAEKAII